VALLEDDRNLGAGRQQDIGAACAEMLGGLGQQRRRGLARPARLDLFDAGHHAAPLDLVVGDDDIDAAALQRTLVDLGADCPARRQQADRPRARVAIADLVGGRVDHADDRLVDRRLD
jgi:hypothetical protein